MAKMGRNTGWYKPGILAGTPSRGRNTGWYTKPLAPLVIMRAGNLAIRLSVYIQGGLKVIAQRHGGTEAEYPGGAKGEY